jgi:hypothetical protein
MDDGEAYEVGRSSNALSVECARRDGEEPEEEREQWGSNMAFLFAAIGSAIGKRIIDPNQATTDFCM